MDVKIGIIAFILVIGSTVNAILCPPGWTKGTIYCYYVNNQINVSWHQAQTECTKRNAELFSIRQVSDQKMFNTLAKNNPSDGFWTGLNQLDADGISGTGNWQWGQAGYAKMSLIHWNTEPNYLNGERCGAVNIQGTFSDELCSRQYGFVCELKQAGCPFGWLFGNGKCYWFTNPNNATMLMTYDAATAFCKGMHKHAFLMTLNIQSDATYLSNQVSELIYWTTYKWWTGLNDRKVKKSWVWANGDTYSPGLVTWTQEPNQLGGAEFCGVILSNGKFNDYNCTMVANFICEIPNLNAFNKGDLGCGTLWSRGGRKCYFMQSYAPQSWTNAKNKCAAMKPGARLLQLQSKDEVNWIMMQIDQSLTSFFWTGLNDQAKEATYMWSDGSKPDMSLIVWNHEPSTWGGSQNCAITLSSGHFVAVSCGNKNGFVCEYANPSGATCKNGWTSWLVTGDCYYVSQNAVKLRQTWYEAKGWCQRNSMGRTGYLTALNSVNEKNFVLSLINKATNPGSTGWWTGLTDMKIPGFWQYQQANNNPLVKAVVTWNMEPDDHSHKQNCVAMTYAGHFVDQTCTAPNGYICEYTLGGSSVKASLYTLLITSIISYLYKYFN